MRWLEGLPIEVTFGDCNDQTSLKEAVKGVDQIFHLAGITKAIHEKTHFEVNARGTENMIHACLENNPHLQKFIYLSSQAAAGPCRNGDKKREADQCEPVSAYGRSKRMGEELALAHAHGHSSPRFKTLCCLWTKGKGSLHLLQAPFQTD